MNARRPDREADGLLRRLAEGENGKAANDLLSHLFQGYPVKRIRGLLTSDNEEAAKSGAWLASELGAAVAPLVDELPRLLAHPTPYVRFFAVEAVLLATSEKDGAVIAEAITLIDDEDHGVRLKAIQLLDKAHPGQLDAGLAHLHANHLRDHVAWLAALSPSEGTSHQIRSRLNDPDPTTRRIAVAGAARLATGNPTSLQHAATSTDPDVHTYAERALRQMGTAARRRDR